MFVNRYALNIRAIKHIKILTDIIATGKFSYANFRKKKLFRQIINKEINDIKDQQIGPNPSTNQYKSIFTFENKHETFMFASD